MVLKARPNRNKHKTDDSQTKRAPMSQRPKGQLRESQLCRNLSCARCCQWIIDGGICRPSFFMVFSIFHSSCLIQNDSLARVLRVPNLGLVVGKFIEQARKLRRNYCCGTGIDTNSFEIRFVSKWFVTYFKKVHLKFI